VASYVSFIVTYLCPRIQLRVLNWNVSLTRISDTFHRVQETQLRYHQQVLVSLFTLFTLFVFSLFIQYTFHRVQETQLRYHQQVMSSIAHD